MTDRPKRKAPTLAAKLAACERRLRELLGTEQIQYDHRPTLESREVNRAGTDFIPPQNDPKFLDALSREEHALRTFGTKATSLNSDAHSRAKIRRLRGENKPKPKRAWPARKMQGRAFEKRNP